jgi:hypothetical protein
MSSGLVSILLCLSMMQSRGEVSVILKTFRLIFLGLFSYSCRYFDTALRMQPLVYFVVIFLASLFTFRAMCAMVSIHSEGGVGVIGRCGMFGCWWLCISFRIGCVRQNGSCCTMYMVLRMRWYVLRCLFHSLASLRGKKPPCCVLFVRMGSGSARQVFSIVSEILLIMLSNVVQASAH